MSACPKDQQIHLPGALRHEDVYKRQVKDYSRERSNFMKRKKTVPAEVVPKPVNDAAPVPEKDHPLYDLSLIHIFRRLREDGGY